MLIGFELCPRWVPLMKYDMPVGTSARAPISAPARPSADHQQRHFELSTQKNTAVACYLEHGL